MYGCDGKENHNICINVYIYVHMGIDIDVYPPNVETWLSSEKNVHVNNKNK